MTTLYRKQASGSIGTWRIWRELSQVRIAHALVEGGREVFHSEDVITNQSGRTLDEQIKLRIDSRISRMLDKGYKFTREEALNSQSNQLGLARPMLAQKFRDAKGINYNGAVLQKKLDGHRCLITKQDGEIIAYSRQGKVIDTIPQITNFLAHRIPEGTTIDGELYLHGYPLQTLASWIKRRQKDSERLLFVAYDIISNDNYIDRHQELSEIVTTTHSHAKVLGYTSYTNSDDLWDFFNKARDLGFEGSMLRTMPLGYESGKRSASLLKIKAFNDDEFKVIGITASKDGWAVCHCRIGADKVFKVSAPGTMEEKRYVLMNLSKFVGKFLTVEYSQLTNDGLPFHPNAIQWREDI